ncbi:MAG: ATP-binding protein [bacterium]
MDADAVKQTAQTLTHKILVVDDEVGIRRGCDRVLRAEGHQVLLAENGEQGLAMLGRDPAIDLVLVDLRMPGMSGFDFLEQARQGAPETVFAVITAYATIESAVEATKRGAYDFIAKPFTPDDLLRLVHRALERVSLIRERNRLEAERRQRMEELAAEKGRLRTVIDCMADGVLVCNADERIVLFNPAAMNMLGTLPLSGAAELAAGAAGEAGGPDGTGGPGSLLPLIADASHERKHISTELRLRRAPQDYWVLANVEPVLEPESGRFLGTVSVLRDITELKRVEHLKAQFVNMVAHELRAPLAAVDGYMAAMEEGYVQDAEKRQEILSRSRKRIRALLDLVGDLLDVSRMETGTVRREIAPRKIDAILKEVAELMRPLADKGGIRLELECAAGLPPVDADGEELIRLFANLVSNAIKYNRAAGEVRITAGRDVAYVAVSVRDTGVGISREGLARLFSEFFREKTDKTKYVTGTGLGLSIVKRIVDFYNGRIDVESQPGKGSTFTVRLPCSAAAGTAGNPPAP